MSSPSENSTISVPDTASAQNMSDTLIPVTTQVTTLPTPPRSPTSNAVSTSSTRLMRSNVKQRKAVKSGSDYSSKLDVVHATLQGALRCCITSEYGQALTDEYLIALALSMLRLEDEIILTIAQNLQLALYLAITNESRYAAEQELEDLRAIRTQIDRVLHGKTQIHHEYLQDQFMLRYWEQAFSIIQKAYLFHSKEEVSYQAVLNRLASIEKRGCEVADRMMNATANGVHLGEIYRTIRAKWMKFDEVIDWYRGNEGRERDAPTWAFITKQINCENERRQRVNDEKPFRKRACYSFRVSYLVSTVITIPLVAVGFSYSSDVPGHWRDPDFWFLLQSTAVLLSGLHIALLSEDIITIWEFAPTLAAAIFGIMAPVLYLKVPTQWSMLSEVMAGIFQTLIILQKGLFVNGENLLPDHGGLL